MNQHPYLRAYMAGIVRADARAAFAGVASHRRALRV